MRYKIMKEDFLHYIWQYKKFSFLDLKTVQGEEVTILNSGNYLQQEGPDFFNAQIILGSQKWAGNIEIHLKSSDWYVHHHEKNEHYDTVILHVVWEYDTPIFRKDNTEIPVLELKKYVSEDILHHYQSLLVPKTWIFCENQIADCDDFILSNWQERLFFERLERKSLAINQLLKETENDWEAVLFYLLAKNFGLNTNGEAFLKIAQSITFSIIRKEALEVLYLEALFFGQSNLLPPEAEDNYTKELQSWYDYLVLKHKIVKPYFEPITFFKHRPDNFPTIRLAQLAILYHTHRNLFSKIIQAPSLQQIYELFDVSISNYWLTHYTFEKESPKKHKKLSKSFIDLLVINTIIPIQFAYNQSLGKENLDYLTGLLSAISPEKNTIIDKFSFFGIKAKNAFHTQSLLQLKNEYCNAKRCLECNIGVELLKKK